MRELILATVVTTTAYLFEKTIGTLKTPLTYLVWGLIILGSLYTHRVYSTEIFDIGNNVVDRSMFDRHCKFIPKGVPAHHVNEDSTPSLEAVRLIKGTNRQDAYYGLNHHANKTQQYEDKLHSLCWYLPETSSCEKAKVAYSTAITAMAASTAGPGAAFAAAFFNFATQVGLQYINEWNEIAFQTNMIAWHSNVAQHYADHINAKGW